jgi:hypothetical protein
LRFTGGEYPFQGLPQLFPDTSYVCLVETRSTVDKALSATPAPRAKRVRRLVEGMDWKVTGMTVGELLPELSRAGPATGAAGKGH